MLRPTILGLVLALSLPAAALAAEEQPTFSPKNLIFSQTGQDMISKTPPARPGDVASPEAIVKALHEAVSGPKGAWDDARLRSLFAPGALIGFTDDDPARYGAISIDELVRIFKELHQQMAWYEKAGAIHVTELHRKGETPVLAVVTRTGNEGTHPVTEPEATRPPTSMTQLVKLQGRWWIISHVW